MVGPTTSCAEGRVPQEQEEVRRSRRGELEKTTDGRLKNPKTNKTTKSPELECRLSSYSTACSTSDLNT